MTQTDFDLSEVLEQLKNDDSGDLVRQMVSFLYQALIDTEATSVELAFSAWELPGQWSKSIRLIQ